MGLVALKIAGIILIFEASNIGSFDLVKSLYSRGVEWLIAAAIGIALVRYGLSIIPRARLHAFVIVYLLVAVVSAAFAENVTLALFGDDHRYLGLTFFADMAILYLATAIAFRTSRSWLVLGAVIGVAVLGSTAYGFVQALGADPIPWGADVRTRPIGTAGNADVFAQLLSAAFAASVGVAVFARGRWSLAWRAAAVVVAVATLGASALVATRGSVLGIGATLLLLPVVLLRVSSPSPARLRWTLASFGVGALILIALFAAPTPLSARARDALSGGGLEDRLVIYQSAVAAVVQRPVFGYGLDNFGVIYPRVREPASVLLHGPDTGQNSAHDWVLQAAATTGIVGLFALIGLVAAGFWSLWSWGLRRSPSGAGPLLLALAAYWVQGLVTVGSITVDWIPWIGLGLAASLQHGDEPILVRRRFPAFVAALILAAALFGASTGLSARRAGLDGKVAALGGAVFSPEVRLAAAERAVREDPFRALYWNALGDAQADQKRWTEAGDAYERAVRLVPTSSTYLEDLARSRAFQALAGDPTGASSKLALAAAVRATQVDPVSPSPRYLYAQVAFLFGDYATALDQVTQAIRIYPIAPEYEPIALQAAAKVDPPVARKALEEIATLRDTAPVHIALAKVDVALGDTSAARTNAMRALELAPGNAEAQSVLQQVGGP